MKRDKQGCIRLGLWQRLKSWWLGRKLRQGKVPRGRVTSQMAAQALAMGTPINAIEGFGLLFARVLRADGSVLEMGLISCQKITTAFRDYLVDSLQNSTTSPLDVFKYHASGTGTTAEANTQTALVTEVATRTSGTQLEGASANIYRSVGTVSYSGAFAITEHGLFSASSAGTLMDRSVFAAINVASGDAIEFTYEATFNAEA